MARGLVSVIISSRNRAKALEETLRAFGNVNVPENWRAELLIVDNGSTDHTPEIVRAARLENFAVRYLLEERAGKSNALNTALAESKGEALLFTDDDVTPARDWLEKLATPLFNLECEGVGGRIQLGEELLRPWMKADHRAALSDSGALAGEVRQLIGANMGLHRSVFERIPGFDPELGPGASGFGEETLLSWQMREAGVRLKWASDAVVVHHPDATRLRRRDWLRSAENRGRSQAYLLHHWQHEGLKGAKLRALQLRMKLALRRILQRPPTLDTEGCPQWEMSYVAELAMCDQFLLERQKPRKYARRGLQKISTAENAPATPLVPERVRTVLNS